MKENKFSSSMAATDDARLEFYHKNPHMFPPEQVDAARWELEKRGKLILTEETAISDQEEIIYPPKPVEVTKENSPQRSIMSMIVFIAGFYFFFNWDLATIFIFVGVILIHELGHFLAMKAFDYKNLNIFFVPMVGALASGSKEEISQKQSIIISLAGPLPGIVIGTLIYAFTGNSENDLLVTTANIFIFLNLFNLLPIMPLDGGRVLETTFFSSNKIIGNIFMLISIALLSYYSLSVESYFLLVIPAFLVFRFFAQNRLNNLNKAFVNKNFNTNQLYGELSDEEYWLMREELGAQVPYYGQMITPGKYLVSSEEQRIINQIKAIIKKKPNKDLTIGGKALVVFIWLLAFVIPIGVIIFVG